jgi:hypothetical protein
MKKLVCAATLMLAAVSLSAQGAKADWLSGQRDHRLAVTGFAVGAGSAGAYWALRQKGGGYPRITRAGAWGLSTVGCMAVSPIIGGIVTQRELTRREVHVMMASCVVPIIGGWLMNAYFDAHPERDSVPVEAVVVRKHHYKAK